MAYKQQLKRLSARYGASMDYSRADYMICVDLAKQGFSSKQLIHALQQASPELPARKAGHEADYCQRTVKAALGNPEVQQHLAQRERQGPGIER